MSARELPSESVRFFKTRMYNYVVSRKTAHQTVSKKNAHLQIKEKHVFTCMYVL